MAFEDDRLGWPLSSAQQFLPWITGMGRDVFYMVPKQMYVFFNHHSCLTPFFFYHILCAQSGFIEDQDRATELGLRVRNHFPFMPFASFSMSHGP